MSDGQVLGLLWIALFIGVGVVVAVIERLVKRPRQNRMRKNFLAAPDPKCIVGESWRAQVQQGHRY
jgi:hypothetical protein